jgi:hypothetical protein
VTCDILSQIAYAVMEKPLGIPVKPVQHLPV